MDKLFAWADTTDAGVFDHTWVTTFEENPGFPNIAIGDYWHCNGGTRTTFRQIAFGVGGLDFARYIAAANDGNATAGIRYGKDGVCHQIANRILRFCIGEDGNMITVKSARGYQISVAMYGHYGGKSKLFSGQNLQEFERTVERFLSTQNVPQNLQREVNMEGQSHDGPS